MFDTSSEESNRVNYCVKALRNLDAMCIKKSRQSNPRNKKIKNAAIKFWIKEARGRI